MQREGTKVHRQAIRQGPQPGQRMSNRAYRKRSTADTGACSTQTMLLQLHSKHQHVGRCGSISIHRRLLTLAAKSSTCSRPCHCIRPPLDSMHADGGAYRKFDTTDHKIEMVKLSPVVVLVVIFACLWVHTECRRWRCNASGGQNCRRRRTEVAAAGQGLQKWAERLRRLEQAAAKGETRKTKHESSHGLDAEWQRDKL